MIDVPERVDEFLEDLDDLYGETREEKIVYALRSFIDRDPPPYQAEEEIDDGSVEVR